MMQLTPALAPPTNPIPPVRLTRRESEVLYWIGEGKSDWEIGCILGVRPKTINYYAERVKQKLDVTNRIQMVRQAVRIGLLPA